MQNKFLLWGTALALSVTANPAISAPILTGDARYSPAGFFGGTLRTGEISGGTALIPSGDTLSLTRGTSTGGNFEDAPNIIVGRRAGTVNEVTIDNSTVTVDAEGSSASAQMARDGVDGQLILQNGATLIIKDDLAASGSGPLSGESISVGRSGSGTGTLSVTDSTIDMSSNSGVSFNAGRQGATGIVLFDNATVSMTDKDPNALALSFASMAIGSDDGSNAQATITNGSTVTISSATGGANFHVGRGLGGTGTVVLDMGSVVDLSTSGPPGSFGADLHIGGRGTGEMDVLNGSKVLFTSSDGDVFIATPNDSRPFAGQGLLRINGVGSEVAATDIIAVGVPDFEDPARTSQGGLIDVSAGGILSTQDGMHVGTNGEIRTDADVRIGTDAVSTPNGANVLVENYAIVSGGGTLTAQNVHLDSGGFLGGNGGNINANVVLNGGVISPGASPGSMTILGDLTYLDGLINIEIGGTNPSEFDFLNIMGSLITPPDTGGPIQDVLRITFLDSYLPQVGDSFDILGFSSRTGGPITAGFFDEAGNRLNGYSMGFSETSSSYGIRVESVPDINVVPLPAALPLLLAGLIGFGVLRRLST